MTPTYQLPAHAFEALDADLSSAHSSASIAKIDMGMMPLRLNSVASRGHCCAADRRWIERLAQLPPTALQLRHVLNDDRR